MKNKSFATEIADPRQTEYIQYAQNVEQALNQLESQLLTSDNPEEIIMNMLVEYVGGSYQINPELNVMTDLDVFTDTRNQAAISSDLVTKEGHTLKKAMDIYKNGLLPSHSSQHWLMPIAAHYSLRYIGVINQLLATLDLAHDYVCIHEYARIAVQAVPGSADTH